MENNLVQKNQYICPICGKMFENYKSLYSHINRSKGNHSRLRNEIGADWLTLTEEQYNSSCDIIANLKAKLFKELEEKRIELEEEKRNKKEIETKIRRMIMNFYKTVKTKCPNISCDVNMIKKHYNLDMTMNEINIVLKYMAKRGDSNLYRFNDTINDALTIYNCGIERDIRDSDTYLICKFFKHYNIRPTNKLIIQGINKLKEVKNEGYTIHDIKVAMEYMLKKRITIFNYISSQIPIAVDTINKDNNTIEEFNTLNELLDAIIHDDLIYKKQMVNMNIFEAEILNKLKNDILNANIDFEKMKNSNSKYKDIAFKLVDYVINKKLYNNKYELSEYIQKIKLY